MRASTSLNPLPPPPSPARRSADVTPSPRLSLASDDVSGCAFRFAGPGIRLPVTVRCFRVHPSRRLPILGCRPSRNLGNLLAGYLHPSRCPDGAATAVARDPCARLGGRPSHGPGQDHRASKSGIGVRVRNRRPSQESASESGIKSVRPPDPGRPCGLGRRHLEVCLA